MPAFQNCSFWPQNSRVYYVILTVCISAFQVSSAKGNTIPLTKLTETGLNLLQKSLLVRPALLTFVFELKNELFGVGAELLSHP